MSRKPNRKQPAVTMRCAVYTRKSTEEGLDQEFNSLDAQREAGEAYVASQQHEGWGCLPELYDDGGFTGGNMERPALQRLMADIEAGKIGFDPEGDLVGVHPGVLSSWRWLVLSGGASFASRVTHEPGVPRNLKPGKAAFCRHFACFSGPPRVAPFGPVWRRKTGPTRRRIWPQDATVRAVFRQSPTGRKGGVDER